MRGTVTSSNAGGAGSYGARHGVTLCLLHQSRNLAIGDAGEFDRGSVGERGDQREATTHGLDRPAQRRQQQVAALLQARDAVLG